MPASTGFPGLTQTQINALIVAYAAPSSHNHAASAITSGLLALARGGTAADLAATGGATHFLRQASVGAALTVGGIVSADLTTALTTPPAIGGGTPAAISGTVITATSSLVGGTAIADILKLQGTVGNGTLTAAAIQALVGNNGATIATTILNNGNVGIGTIAPGARLEVAGSTDATQFILRANSAQSNSNPLIKLLSSGGTELLRLHSDNTNNVFLGTNAGRVNNVSGVASEGLYNTFIGSGAGYSNTTGSSNSAQGWNALYSNTTGSNNNAQGVNALLSNTTGSSNSAQGANALRSNTTGNDNNAQGLYALLSNTTGSSNSAQGRDALAFNTTGGSNSAQGVNALLSNTTGSSNSAQGANALRSNTTGSNNSAQGVNAGRYISDGTTANATSGTSLYLGADTKALANGGANEIVIGYNAIGVGSNSAVFGNDSITKTVLKGSVGLGTTTPAARLHVLDTTAGSLSSVVNAAVIGRNDTGTPLAGFGSGLALQLESSTTPDTSIGSIDWLWNVATHASRAPDMVFNLTDSAATREIMRMRANGSAGAIGFFGATPIARPTLAANATDLATAITLVNDIKAKLSAAASGLGLVA